MTYLMAGSISNSSTSNNSISNNSVSNKMSVGAGHPFSALQRRDYRLIDCFHQPHPHLDGLYESGDEAIADAISWLQSIGSAALDASIGLEVSTASGDWRTIRQPELLLCPLPSKEEG